jgi:transcriptional regulator of PTS gene
MRETGMNMSRVKEQNRYAVLSEITRTGPVSRKDIASRTGLTPASLTQITSPLLKQGILIESGRAAKETAGRRKVLLELNEAYGCLFTLNIDRAETTVSLCSLKGSLLGQKVRKTLHSGSPASLLKRAARDIQTIRNAQSASIQKKILGISVGIAGTVDRREGISLLANGIWEKPVKVAEILQKETGLDVIVENNVNAFAQAELLFGKARNHENLLVIKWGPGVGSALILHNELFEGRGRPSEIGHFLRHDGTTIETHLSKDALDNSNASLNRAVKELSRTIVSANALVPVDEVILYGSLIDEETAGRIQKECARYDKDLRVIRSDLDEAENRIGECAVFLERKVF